MNKKQIDLPLYERLEKHPDSFSRRALRILMNLHINSRGRNARIPAQAFLELERRSPTRKGKK